MSTENLKNQSQQGNKKEADASNRNQKIETPQRSDEQRAGSENKDQRGSSGYSQGGKRSDD